MSIQAQLLKQQAIERSAARRSAASPNSVISNAAGVEQINHPTRPAASAAGVGQINHPTRAAASATTVESDDSDSVWGAILGTLIGLALAAAGFAIGVGAFGLVGETQSFWYLSRSAGFVAYLLLWGSVVWGLLLSSKIAKGAARPAALLDAHQFLSGVGLGFGFFHGLILMGDRYLAFPLAAVLLPFGGTYEPLLVAAGQIGLWLSALLVVTFYVRRWIGQKAWRWIHFSSFLAFWAVVYHSAALGTESALPWVQLFYLLTGGVVFFLTTYRMLAGRQQAKQVA